MNHPNTKEIYIIASVSTLAVAFGVFAIGEESGFIGATLLGLIVFFCIGIVPHVVSRFLKSLGTSADRSVIVLYSIIILSMFGYILKSAAEGPGEIVLMVVYIPFIAAPLYGLVFGVCQLMTKLK